MVKRNRHTRTKCTLLLKVKQAVLFHTLGIHIICFNCCQAHQQDDTSLRAKHLKKKALQSFQSLFVFIPFSSLRLQAQAELPHLS